MFGFLFGSKHKRVINRISKTVDQINSLESSLEQLNADDLLAKSNELRDHCLLYTSPSPRDGCRSRMPSSA